MRHTMFTPLVLAALAATPVRAQYYYGDGSGTSYGTRIGVGVGIAVAVVLVIFLVGCLMRRRRARAFKTAFPLQQVAPTQPYNVAEQGQAHGYYGQQWNPQSQGGVYPQQPQYGQQYVSNAGGGADAPPPQYSNYRQDSSSHYAPPPVPPPAMSHASSQQRFAPPTSPAPAASASTYAPPSSNGAPPTHDAQGKELSGEEREAWQAAQEARERELSQGANGAAAAGK